MQVAIVPGTPLGSSQYKFKIFIENPQKDGEEEKKKKEEKKEGEEKGRNEEKEKEKPAPPAGPPPPGLPPPPPPGLPPPPPPGGVKGFYFFTCLFPTSYLLFYHRFLFEIKLTFILYFRKSRFPFLRRVSH